MSRVPMFLVSMALGLGFLSDLAVQAQSLEDLPIGARVRVTVASETGPTASGPRLIGRVAEMRPGSIALATEDPGALATEGHKTRELRRDAIVRLERSIRPSRKGRGALIGFGVSFAAWFTLLAMEPEWECLHDNAGACAVDSAILALPSAVVGALVAPGEQWADVPLDARTPGPAARSGRLQLRVVPQVGRRSGLSLVASF